MILIADGGSTKTNWCLVTEGNKQVYFDTEGYNPDFLTKEEIVASLEYTLPTDLNRKEVTEVHYYGAGCSTREKQQAVAEAMQVVFTKASIVVHHDLLAAARALLGCKAGFAAILGTGSNTCLYDGKKITHSINSLAYILGDEGSACYIGKKLLGDYIRGYLPKRVHEAFWNTYELTPEEILRQIYRRPLPNRFCASFSKFIYDNDVDKAYTHSLIKTSFFDFFNNIVRRYPDYQHYDFNCIGSVGYVFRKVLEETAQAFGMKVGKILQSPIDNLVKYHIRIFSADNSKQEVGLLP